MDSSPLKLPYKRLRTAIGAVLRSAAASRGYDFHHRSLKRYGNDPWLDVARLAELLGAPIRTVLDVGANEGQTARVLSRAFPDASIHAFEPVRETFEKLKANTNSHDRIICHNVACGSKNGTAPIYLYQSSLLSSLVPDAKYPTAGGLTAVASECAVQTIDEFCAASEIGSIDILKVDTEGYDIEVLSGARNMLERGAIKFVVVEFNDIGAGGEPEHGDLAPIAALLRSVGMKFVCAYTDFISTEREFVVVANALFVAA